MSSRASIQTHNHAHFTLLVAFVALAGLAGCGPKKSTSVVAPELAISLRDGWYSGSLSKESTCAAGASATATTCSIEGNVCDTQEDDTDDGITFVCPVQFADNTYNFDCRLDLPVYCDDWNQDVISIRYQGEVRVDGDQMIGSFTTTMNPAELPCTLPPDAVAALCQSVNFEVHRVEDVVGDCTDETLILDFECQEDASQAKTLGRGSLDLSPRVLRHLLRTVVAQSQDAAR